MPPLQWTVIAADLDPVRGSEQRGRRPVLIVSHEMFNQVMSTVTVLPLTSTQRRLYPGEVFIRQEAAGQPLDSIVLAHQIRTISKERLGRVYGRREDPALQRAVHTAIRQHLHLR